MGKTRNNEYKTIGIIFIAVSFLLMVLSILVNNGFHFTIIGGAVSLALLIVGIKMMDKDADINSEYDKEE